MTGTTAILAEAISQLSNAAERHDWSAAEDELAIIAEEAVAAIAAKREDDVEEASRQIDRFASVFHVQRAENVGTGPQFMAGALRALALVLITASRYKRAPGKATLAREGLVQKILRALDEAPLGLDGNHLARAVGCARETLSRKIVDLRRAGLVDSRKIGRATVNMLGDGAKDYLETAPVPADLFNAGYGSVVRRYLTAEMEGNTPSYTVNAASMRGRGAVRFITKVMPKALGDPLSLKSTDVVPVKVAARARKAKNPVVLRFDRADAVGDSNNEVDVITKTFNTHVRLFKTAAGGVSSGFAPPTPGTAKKKRQLRRHRIALERSVGMKGRSAGE